MSSLLFSSATLRQSISTFAAAVVFLWLGTAVRAEDPAAAPRNVGRGLAEVANWNRAQPVTQAATTRATATREHLRQQHPRAQSDAAGRVVVDVLLDGRASLAQVREALGALGVEVFAEHPATGRAGSAFGRLSAWLPVERTAEAAAIPGVQSVVLVHRPWKRVGKATSQGVGVLRADAVQARFFTGKNITVGVISDSYDLTTPHAADDVAADDLPGFGNPAGRATPVVVLQEGNASDDSNADEGRAMLQIIHDIAPDAKLAFQTVGATQTTFANAIRNLRTNPSAFCDVIVDDIGFPDEPFFSDGIVAQAVDDVVTRNDLPGRPVIFYSAAGNSGDVGFECDWTPVSGTDARARGGRGHVAAGPGLAAARRGGPGQLATHAGAGFADGRRVPEFRHGQRPGRRHVHRAKVHGARRRRGGQFSVE